MRAAILFVSIAVLAACAEETAPQTALTLTRDQQLAFDWCASEGERRGEAWADIKVRCQDLAQRSKVGLRGAS